MTGKPVRIHILKLFWEDGDCTVELFLDPADAYACVCSRIADLEPDLYEDVIPAIPDAKLRRWVRDQGGLNLLDFKVEWQDFDTLQRRTAS